jgi:hypothetical protein
VTVFAHCRDCGMRVCQVVDALLATARSAWQPEDAGDFVLGDPTLRSAMETSSLFAFLDGAVSPTACLPSLMVRSSLPVHYVVGCERGYGGWGWG